MANTTTYTLILNQEKAREFIMPEGYWPDVEIHCWGAGGGSGWGGGVGGGGGYSSVLVDIDPGDRVRLQIGQPGRNASNPDTGGSGGSDRTDSRFDGGKGGRRIANTETKTVNYVIDDPLTRSDLTNNVTSIIVSAANGPYPSGGGGGASWVSINDSIVCVAAGGGGGAGYGKNGAKNNGNPGGVYPTQVSSVYAVSYYKWSSFLNTYGVWGGGEDYTTTVNFPVTGTYTFALSTDNFGSIYVDDTLVLSYGEYRNATSTTASFTAGAHIVRVTGGNYGGPAGVGALITAPGGAPIWNTRELLVTSGLTNNSQGGDAVYGGGGGGGYYGGKSGLGIGGAVTGGNGGQNYGTVTAPGSGVFPGGRSGYYPGNKVGEAGYAGYIVIVMRRKMNIQIKNPDGSGNWRRVDTPYVKIPTQVKYVTITLPPKTLAFESKGVSTWTVPVGVTSISVIANGGAGGGGGGDAGKNYNGNGVGGGGANRKTQTIAVTPGQKLTITVGAGGAGGPIGGDGIDGTPSSITGAGVSFTTGAGTHGGGYYTGRETGIGADGANNGNRALFGGAGGTSTNGGANGGAGGGFKRAGGIGGGGKVYITYQPLPEQITVTTGGWKQIQQVFTKVNGEWKPILTDLEIVLHTY